MQSVESGNQQNTGRADAGTRRVGWASRGSGITFAAMVVILIVALLFAANQNDVIGWLLVVISAGWLVLAVLVTLGVRRGARSVDRKMKDLSASMATRTTDHAAQPGPSASSSASPVDPMRDTKLDHSFKIVQVQARVVTEELDKGTEADSDMVARALETIHITSANAREMLKAQGSSTRSSTRPGPGNEGPISGEVIN